MQLPSRNPRRRNARPEERVLPPRNPVRHRPVWPLQDPATPAERKLWFELWTLPQAVAWQTLGINRVIARYCRLSLLAEDPEASAPLLNEVRQLEDRIGLNPVALRRLGWEIAGPDEAGADDPVDIAAIRARLG
ncbi:MAG TPA: hypothetical protein VLM76_09385 [Patescibacteria group bacterium]|nr:hypothetical protein [Patescibacteria group bacterium]